MKEAGNFSLTVACQKCGKVSFFQFSLAKVDPNDALADILRSKKWFVVLGDDDAYEFYCGAECAP